MENQLDGRKVLLVVPPAQFREEEVFEPKRILEKAGAEVVVASTSARLCRGSREGVIEATVSLAEASATDFDAVIVTGGPSVPEVFWKDKDLQQLVTGMSEAGKLVAAISLSTVVLARARLLEGRAATVYHLPEAIEELNSGGATYVGQNLIVDGNLIMAEGPASVPAFTDAILSSLAG